jgi:predicted phage terminase large subunit-like protein
VIVKAPAWWPDLSGLDPDARAAILARLTPPLRLRYTPTRPSPRQFAFVSYTGKEAFYGGAAGGGKSWALLMAALQYADVPGYHALILRRTLEELKLPGALIEISRQWLGATDARWNGNDRRWTFPSGATLSFGYIGKLGAETRYQSANFSFIGFDEVTAFEEDIYTFMFARCRRGRGSPLGLSPDGVGVHDVPLRVRSASNPGGDGHEWVKTRFIDGDSRLAPFFPSALTDNPHLDVDAYLEMFGAMSDPVTRQRMLEGDWDVEVEGTRFNRRWFTPIDAVAGGAIRSARHWDLAATEVGPAARNPDYTVGTLVHRYPSARYVVADVVRGRWSSAKVEAIMRATAATDGRGVMVGVEQEPGSAGKAMVSHVKRNVLAGYNVQGMLPTGDKFTRAGPVASAAEDGRIDVLRAPWLPAWLSELGLFSERYKGHDDQVDSLSGAFELVHRAGRTTTRRTRSQLPVSMARQVA